MKPAIYLLSLIAVLQLSIEVKAQTSPSRTVPYYSDIPFNGSWFLQAESDDKWAYYAVDLDHFSSAFEKAYFQNLAYEKNSRLVRVDAGNASIAWFKVKKQLAGDATEQYLNSLKTRTLARSSQLTEPEKQQWLSSNGK